MKTEQSSSGGEEPFICSLGPKRYKQSHTCIHYNYNKVTILKKYNSCICCMFFVCLLFQHMRGVILKIIKTSSLARAFSDG